MIGISYHFGSYKRFSIRNALIVLDDLSLDIIQSQIDVSRFLALALCSVAFHIPYVFVDALLATELSHRTVDCHSSHNRNNIVFLFACVHVEQHLKCTSHNLIFLGYKISYQRVIN